MERPKNIFQKVRDKEVLDYLTFLEEKARLMDSNPDAKAYVMLNHQLNNVLAKLKDLDIEDTALLQKQQKKFKILF